MQLKIKRCIYCSHYMLHRWLNENQTWLDNWDNGVTSFFSQSIWYDMNNPVSKVHGANMGPTWVLSVPDGPHDGPMNLAIWEEKLFCDITYGVYCRQYVEIHCSLSKFRRALILHLWSKEPNSTQWIMYPLELTQKLIWTICITFLLYPLIIPHRMKWLVYGLLFWLIHYGILRQPRWDTHWNHCSKHCPRSIERWFRIRFRYVYST